MPVCDICGAPGPYKCSKCGDAFYCSIEHQRQAWKGHKAVCSSSGAVIESFQSSTTGPGKEKDGPSSHSPARAAGSDRSPVTTTLKKSPVPMPQAAVGTNEALRDGICLYINLERRSDRRKRMETLCKPHPWLSKTLERTEAVDGSGLSWPRLVGEKLFTVEAELEAQKAVRMSLATLAATPQDCSPHLTLGGCGCALSHRNAWQALVDSEAKWALIFEDDLVGICASFDDEFAATMRQLAASCAGWHVCYLGFHTGEMLRKGQHCTGPLIKLRSCNGWLAGLWAYVISRAGAELMLKLGVPFAAQVDTVVGCIAASRNRSYAVPPGQFLAFSLPTEDSRDTDVQTFPEDMQ